MFKKFLPVVAVLLLAGCATAPMAGGTCCPKTGKCECTNCECADCGSGECGCSKKAEDKAADGKTCGHKGG